MEPSYLVCTQPNNESWSIKRELDNEKGNKNMSNIKPYNEIKAEYIAKLKEEYKHPMLHDAITKWYILPAGAAGLFGNFYPVVASDDTQLITREMLDKCVSNGMQGFSNYYEAFYYWYQDECKYIDSGIFVHDGMDWFKIEEFDRRIQGDGRMIIRTLLR